MIDPRADAKAVSTRPRRDAEQFWAIASVVVLAVVGLWLRWTLAMRGGLWRDEGLSLFVAKLTSWETMLNFLKFHESHPPLFYALMRTWISAFGDTDSISVIPAVVFGVALIPTIFFVGRSLFSQRIGLIAAALAALSPALVEYSSSARPYSLLPLLTLLSIYTLIQASHRFSISKWAAYVVSTIALLYTHNWAWLILLGEWVAVLFLMRDARGAETRLLARQWLTAQACVALAYAPWLSALIYQVRHAGHAPSLLNLNSDFILALGISVKLFLESTLLGYGPVRVPGDRYLEWMFVLPLLLFTIDQYLFSRGRHSRPSCLTSKSRHQSGAMQTMLIIPIVVFVVALALSSRSELIMTRCLVALAPLVLLVLASWLIRPGEKSVLVATRATIGVLVITYVLSLHQLLLTTRSNARELAIAIAARTSPFDLVVVSPEWLASSFNRYYAPAVDQIDFPNIGREGAVDFTGVLARFRNEVAAERALSLLRDARNRSRRVWLIFDHATPATDSPDEIPKLLNSNNYTLVASARTIQLRAELDSMYGPPDTINVSNRTPRYEFLDAFLYSPR